MWARPQSAGVAIFDEILVAEKAQILGAEKAQILGAGAQNSCQVRIMSELRRKSMC